MFNALTKKYKEKRGFTLMEVLVVVGIIAIIVAISVTGILKIRENLAFRQKNDYAKSIFMAAQSHLTELRATSGLEHLQNISNTPTNLDDPSTPDKVEFEDYRIVKPDDTAYSIVLPLGSVDETIRTKNVLIEYNPKNGNVYSVFYSESNIPLYTQYVNSGLPRNGEGDEERRKEMMLGYYDGSDLSGEELGVMSIKADITFDNGEEGLVTVIVPTQDDTGFSIAEDGNYNRYMTNLSVKLTIVGEMGGTVETVIKESGNFKPDSCYVVADTSTGANMIHITYPIDSLAAGKSFLNLAVKDGTIPHPGGTLTSIGNEDDFVIQPGDNVSITAEVTYDPAPTDPIVEIEDALIAGVNPMFHSLTAGSAADKYILTVSNGRNLQNLNALAPSIAQNVESVIFVNPDGSTSDVVIDWNNTVEYYNNKYGQLDGERVYRNTNEAPARALPYFVPIMNSGLMGRTNSAKFYGNGVKIYDLNIDASRYTIPSETYFAVDSVSYEKAGLFATANTEIMDIYIVNPVIRGSASGTPATGALVGELQLNGTVSNCGVYVDTEDIDFVRSKLNMSSFDGSDDQYGVSGSGAVGGLIGYAMSAEVDSSFAAVPVYGANTSGNGVGGLVGLSADTQYQKCYASGTVGASFTSNTYGAGGFVGTSSNSKYENCFATGDVKTTTGEKGCAGFVGVLNGSANFTNCYSVGYANLDEDFCGFISQNVPITKTNSYFLSQTETEGERNKIYSLDCAAVKIYDDMEKLTPPDGSFPSDKWGSAEILTTHAYDIALGNNKYPFTMLTGLNYYGNWPTKPLEAGIAYYEIYDTDNNGSGDTLGVYFDREKTSTLRSDRTVTGDGYMILAGTLSDNVTVTSLTPNVPLQKIVETGNIKDVIEIDGKSYAVFPLTSTVLDASAKDTFYTALDVAIDTKDENGNTIKTTAYRFFYNPNVALSHFNPTNPVVTQDYAPTAPDTVPSIIYIRTARQLAAVGENMASFWDENYIQQLDIDFNKYKDGDKLNPAPIGTSSKPFTGSYIGRKDNGETPAIIGYKPADAENSGIFSVIGNEGVVRNLDLIVEAKDSQTTLNGGGKATDNIGLLAGQNKGSIENVNLKLKDSVTLAAKNTAGLLVGTNSGRIVKSSVEQKEDTATLNAPHAGGLVGSVAEGSKLETVSVKLNNLAGSGTLAGMFGKINSGVSISGMHLVLDNTSITSSGSAAGFVGTTAGDLYNCSVRGKGSIEGETSAAGFAVTVSGGTVDGCVVSPALTETKEAYEGNGNSNLRISGASAAGFAVENRAKICACTALGSVNGDTDAAGFVITNSGTIEYCMSNVDMTAGTVFAKTNSSTVKECYGWADSTVTNADGKKNFQNIAVDSTGSYTSSYFGLMDSDSNVVLYDVSGQKGNYPTASLAQPSTLNKLTGGSVRSVWVQDDSMDEYPYDTVTLSNYPYPMLREHCGNWPTPSDAFEYGVLYYEKYENEDGTFTWGVDLINMTDIVEDNRSIKGKEPLADEETTVVSEAGYALFCKIDTQPFQDGTNKMIGQLLAVSEYNGLYQAAGLAPTTDTPYVYGLYALDISNVQLRQDLVITVQGPNSAYDVNLIPLFADTLDDTTSPYKIRTQGHFENISKLPEGIFEIDRCFSIGSGFKVIETFGGTLTAEKDTLIKATNLPTGLFMFANNATIDGVTLNATISGKPASGSNTVFGTLVNTAKDCTITNCTVSTNITVYAPDAPATSAEETENTESVTQESTESSQPAVQKGSLTIGGIIGRMQGGTLENSTISGSVISNPTDISNLFACTIGGAVGDAGSNDEKNGRYESVESNVQIHDALKGQIGELVGLVRSGTFIDCIGNDATATRQFFGEIQEVLVTPNVAPTHSSTSPNGPYSACNSNPRIVEFNATFDNCICNNLLVVIQPEVYYFSNVKTDYSLGNQVSGVTISPDSAPLNKADIQKLIDQPHAYYIRHEGQYHKVTVTSTTVTSDNGTTETYVFSCCNEIRDEWTPTAEDDGYTGLYTIELDMKLDSQKNYVILTYDGQYILYRVNDGFMYAVVDSNVTIDADYLYTTDGSTLQHDGISFTPFVPDKYSAETTGISLSCPDVPVVTLGAGGTTYTHFLVYEANESYGDPIAVSYKYDFVPTT